MAGARSEWRWWRTWEVFARVSEGDRGRIGRGTYRTCYLGEGTTLARALARVRTRPASNGMRYEHGSIGRKEIRR